MKPTLKKKLGQHHLVDGHLCRPLVDFLNVDGRRVVEIGPGGGVLTEELLAAGAKVWALEIDCAWAFALPASPTLGVVVGDALDFDWRRWPEGACLAGNLPYNVATAILRRFFLDAPGWSRAAVLVQKEVAERLVAKPGERSYGALSIEVALAAEAEILGRVRPGSFHPPPKVDSAFVGFRARPHEKQRELGRLARLAFTLPRKTLINNLSQALGRPLATAVVERLQWSPTTRAGSLDLASFALLFEALQDLGGSLPTLPTSPTSREAP